ncbi:MAG: hypothetical protein SRB2_02584 [Desulfobacteraceae bacterium Eth-SRB2]|nr:MAG: hypothetical protein SRB2_02584 [Desulfobacteraceae bacterium Eth-SRB2]
MKTGYNKGMIDQLKKFLEDELDYSAAIKRWSMQVSAFLNTALGADEAANFLKLNDPNEYDEYALRYGHLQGLISKAEAEIHPAKSSKDPVPALSAPSVGIAEARKVFVVHGRDGRIRDDFFSFLRALGLQPIEWSEALKFTGKATPYIGEALESAFKNAQAVVVLLSPDDEVRLSPELWKTNEDENEKSIRLQARPNVLFEAGMAFGTHPDRTILIEVGKVKSFSDVAGRHVVRLSNSSNKRNDIAERLRTAGCDVSKTGNDWLNIGNFEIIREQKNPSNINAYISDGNEKISNETLVISKLIHPGLQDRSHNNCVITGRLFNKSNQKVVINKVKAYDHNSKPLNITWSNQIDQYGNPEKPYELIGFVDSEDIFIRQNNGEEIEYCKLEIFHSFSQEPLTCVFDEYEDWIGQ